MWGIVPAAGRGSRIQPLAFSKELLPVGSRRDNGSEKPVAVAEHLLDRMVTAGVDKIAMVISPEKTDILEYFGSRWRGAQIFYVVQPQAAGLCDAIFQALPLIEADETVVVGLPDTVWFPETALRCLRRDALSFLLFPVDEPQRFDAVVVDARDRVEAIEVKSPSPRTAWVWGAFSMPGRTLAELHRLWSGDGRGDEYIGTLVNAWLARGGTAYGIKAGEHYIDVGTIEGYRAAIAILQGAAPPGPAVHRAEQEGSPLPVSMEVQP